MGYEATDSRRRQVSVRGRRPLGSNRGQRGSAEANGAPRGVKLGWRDIHVQSIRGHGRILLQESLQLVEERWKGETTVVEGASAIPHPSAKRPELSQRPLISLGQDFM